MKYIRKRNIALNVGGQMSRPILATCNHCENITTIEYKTKKHPKGLTETYFKCVVCNHHYTCFVTDQKVRDMQSRAKRLRAAGKQKELQELQEKINKRMAKLKQNIAGVADG